MVVKVLIVKVLTVVKVLIVKVLTVGNSKSTNGSKSVKSSKKY